ncbi:hypothetical protein ACE2AJ_05120 [Aquihabitans daechungensis]|uniref:hypothetical protein n=1 Tax=Aquihabitans daechungensis TaxID=1052257 RepID=UPI003BA26D0D
MNAEDPTTTPTDGLRPSERAHAERYEIRVAGRLGSRWVSWFDGLTLVSEDDGTTIISGPVVDQAALHGLLQKLRDLGIPLLSLARTPPGEAIEHPVSPTVPNPTTTPGAPS